MKPKMSAKDMAHSILIGVGSSKKKKDETSEPDTEPTESEEVGQDILDAISEKDPEALCDAIAAAIEYHTDGGKKVAEEVGEDDDEEY